MECGYGPVPIIPDIDRKIGSSIFIRADAPLAEVSSPSEMREHKNRARQHVAYFHKIRAYLGMPVQNVTSGGLRKLDSPAEVVDTMVGQVQRILN